MAADKPVLLVSDDGRIADANGAARDMLGDCVGRMCADAVQAIDFRRQPICRDGCAAELRDGAAQEDRAASIHGEAQRLICSSLADHVVVHLLDHGLPDPIERPLSPRERQALQLVAQGLTTAVIAIHLGVSPATARTHLDAAMEKLGAKNRPEAVARAIATGQI